MDTPPSFKIRWKGHTLGPFTKEVIERKLQSNELSLMHEIQVEDRWISLKAFQVQIHAKEQEEHQRQQLLSSRREASEQARREDQKARERQEAASTPPVEAPGRTPLHIPSPPPHRKAEETTNHPGVKLSISKPGKDQSANPIDQLMSKLKRKREQ